MAVKPIDVEKCIGCKKCINACRTKVIRYSEEKCKAVVVMVRDCTVCGLCQRVCPAGAITVEPGRVYNLR